MLVQLAGAALSPNQEEGNKMAENISNAYISYILVYLVDTFGKSTMCISAVLQSSCWLIPVIDD